MHEFNDRWGVSSVLRRLRRSAQLNKEHHVAPARALDRLPSQTEDGGGCGVSKHMAQVLADDLRWHVVDVLGAARFYVPA